LLQSFTEKKQFAFSLSCCNIGGGALKMLDQKMLDESAGLENARLENDKT